ncbi:MAG: hypothetical protein ACKPCM_00060, partial [Pseudanabaena sp.]
MFQEQLANFYSSSSSLRSSFNISGVRPLFSARSPISRITSTRFLLAQILHHSGKGLPREQK